MSEILSAGALKKVFTEQLSILYSAKSHLIKALPELAEQATFPNLKLALGEDLSEVILQMTSLNKIFDELQVSVITDDCLAMTSLVEEARNKISYNKLDRYAGDITILFYTNVIEHMQMGAYRILKVMTSTVEYLRFNQLITESLDIAKDNARLFKCITQEYLKN